MIKSIPPGVQTAFTPFNCRSMYGLGALHTPNATRYREHATYRGVGPFEASTEQHPDAQPKRSYQAKPMRSRMDTTELYARYKTEQLNSAAACSAARTKALERKAQQIAAAKRSGAMKRAALKLVSADRLAKKALYALINQTLKNEIKKAHHHSRLPWASTPATNPAA